MFKYFTMDVDDGVCLLTYSRPPVNALSFEAWGLMGDVLEHINNSTEIRAVVLAGQSESRSWLGGGDLKEFGALTPDTRRETHKVIWRALGKLYALSQPIVAAVTGHALGGGMVTASLCDMIVASDNAVFGMPEIDYGLTGGAGAFFHRMNLPLPFIREMQLTGSRHKADEMLRLGFLNYVLPKERVVEKSLELARKVANRSFPAVRATKLAAKVLDDPRWMDCRVMAEEANIHLVANEDFRECINAFFERREPRCKHR